MPAPPARTGMNRSIEKPVIVLGIILLAALAAWLEFSGSTHRLVYLGQSERNQYGFIQLRTTPAGDYVTGDIALASTLQRGCTYDMNFPESLVHRRDRVRLIRTATRVAC